MGESKTPFKTNIDQKVGPVKARRKIRKTGLGKPIKAVKVDEAQQKSKRLKWVLKWVLFLPVSAYALVWLLVMGVDLFRF